MSVYPEKIQKRQANLRNNGSVESAAAAGMGVSFTCGCFVRIGLLMDEDQRITASNFVTNGCGFAAAAADVIAEHVSGLKLTELHGAASGEVREWCEQELGAFPDDRGHCLGMAAEALQNALAEHRACLLAECQGDKALICTCFGVSEERITALIEANGLSEVEEVSALCNAGTGCGSCRMMIHELLDVVHSERQ